MGLLKIYAIHYVDGTFSTWRSLKFGTINANGLTMTSDEIYEFLDMEDCGSTEWATGIGTFTIR